MLPYHSIICYVKFSIFYLMRADIVNITKRDKNEMERIQTIFKYTRKVV